MVKNLYLEAMEDFKESVKCWLKDNGRDRFWLAKQLFVEKGTVDDWMKKGGADKKTDGAFLSRCYG